MANGVKAILFDFGGVLAEEGFREGLLAIGRTGGLDPQAFFSDVDAAIYETGYLTGRTDEASFWKAVREKTGISGSDNELREDILTRFVLRPDMLAYADRLREQGRIVAMLSDQTNWLEELDRRTSLFRHFDVVFNSYRLHKSKRDATVFTDVCGLLGVEPGETLFVDDNAGHVRRAESAGLRAIRFVTLDDFQRRMRGFVP